MTEFELTASPILLNVLTDLRFIWRLGGSHSMGITLEVLFFRLCTIFAGHRSRRRPRTQPALVDTLNISKVHKSSCSPTPWPFRELICESPVTFKGYSGPPIIARYVSFALTVRPNKGPGASCTCWLGSQNRWAPNEVPALDLLDGVTQAMDWILRINTSKVGMTIRLVGRVTVQGRPTHRHPIERWGHAGCYALRRWDLRLPPPFTIIVYLRKVRNCLFGPRPSASFATSNRTTLTTCAETSLLVQSSRVHLRVILSEFGALNFTTDTRQRFFG